MFGRELLLQILCGSLDVDSLIKVIICLKIFLYDFLE
jgi:hypothetical protein